MGAEGQKQDDRDRNADQIKQNRPHGSLAQLLNLPSFNAALGGAFLAVAPTPAAR
jgi:hypothetical protein